MARKKPPLGVAEGFDFESESDNNNEATPVAATEIVSGTSNDATETAPIKSDGSPAPGTERSYSTYYTPKPKTGKKGGVIGHPPVSDEMRRKPVSFYCNDVDKQRYLDAAKKDGRKFPDFVNKALMEYIENHNL